MPAEDMASFDPTGGLTDMVSAGDALAGPDGAGLSATPGDRARPRVLVRALSDSWIQLLDPSGSPLYSHILRKGEEFVVPDRPGVRLTVGNTGTVRLVVDGRVLPALGPDGTIRRNIALDPETLAALH
jgi:cytoskeleton protein RodZ